MNIAGLVVVIALCVSVLALASLGIYDLVKRRDQATASNWAGKFFIRHPVAAFAGGVVIGILAGHFMWAQVIRVCYG